MSTEEHENIAQLLLDEHPFGTVVTAERLLSWTEQNADSHTIKEDLRIDDSRRKLAALRRHYNEGARSQNVSEDRRYFLDVEDAKRGRFIIRPYADYAHERAGQAFMRSAGAAIAPINSAMKVLDDVKADELPADKKEKISNDRQNLEAIREPVSRCYREEADRRIVATLVYNGQSAEQAQSTLASLQGIEPYQRLLRKLT
jgi:hypothetical protein